MALNAICSSRENATCCVDGKDVHFTVQLMTPLLITVYALNAFCVPYEFVLLKHRLALYLGFYLVFVSGATFGIQHIPT